MYIACLFVIFFASANGPGRVIEAGGKQKTSQEICLEEDKPALLMLLEKSPCEPKVPDSKTADDWPMGGCYLECKDSRDPLPDFTVKQSGLDCSSKEAACFKFTDTCRQTIIANEKMRCETFFEDKHRYSPDDPPPPSNNVGK